MSRLLRSNMVAKQTFGETLRRLRENNKMPLRKLAALLEIDQSTLSKIERSERKANRTLIEKLSYIFNVNQYDLYINYITDKMAFELINEEKPIDILKIIKAKIDYLQSKKILNDNNRNKFKK